MDRWFINPFLGSNVPVTYEQMITFEDELTGEKQTVLRKDIIGYVFTDDLQKFMIEMNEIQRQVTI